MNNASQRTAESFWKGFGMGMLLLVVILGLLFHSSFKPGIVLFANDGPLGVLKADYYSVPAIFTGFWMDLVWLGMSAGAAPASGTYALLWALGPIGFAKFYAPITLLILGATGWIFSRTLGLSSGLCTLVSIAAALNMNYFSNTCWGLGSRSLCLASVFLALAALSLRRAGNRWMNVILAGLAVGLAVVEGADNGAIFSLVVAAFVLFQFWVEDGAILRMWRSLVQLALVAVFAGLMATQMFWNLRGIIGTAGVGVSGAKQDAETKAKQWDFATQWSLPKIETLRVIIPGLFGYRMDTEGGGAYWGRVGEYPAM